MIRDLTASELEKYSGGIPDIWEAIGFMWQMQYRGYEANNFAPSVMPYK